MKLENKKIYLILQMTTDAIIIADKNLNIVLWNNGAKKIFGFSKDEMLNSSLYKIFHNEVKLSDVKGKGIIEMDFKKKMVKALQGNYH